MDSGSQERLAGDEAAFGDVNDARFRDVNEAIRSGRWPGEDGAPGAFRCECAHLGCNEMIELSLEEYERVRAGADRFVLAPNHHRPELEDVLEDHGRYLVVEKRRQEHGPNAASAS